MLVVIQFDATNLALLKRLLAAGRLPNLAGLRKRGQWNALHMPSAFVDSGGLSFTLYSGKPLSEHGLYYAFQWVPAEQRVRFYRDFAPPETIWERLGRAGHRSLVVDPYDSAPARAFNGIVLSGWQFTNRVSLPRWGLPQDVLPDLYRRFGKPQPADEVFGTPSAEALLRQREKLLAGTERLADGVLHLLDGSDFDLVWATFVAAHFAGHQMFDVSQLPLDDLDAEQKAKLQNALPDIYEGIDRALGRIVATLPAEADIIVLSPYGMGADSTRFMLLPGMLQAVLDGTAAAPPVPSALWRLRALLPTGLRDRIAGLLPDDVALRLAARLELRGIDWRTTRAFVLPSDDNGYIRLNIRGRERDGIVAPEDAPALVEQIADGLATFRDIDGGPAIDSFERTLDRGADGAGPTALPDLIVRFHRQIARPLRGVVSPRFGTVPHPGLGTGRTGAHSADAWALLVPGAARLRPLNRPPQVEDIAATVCNLVAGSSEGLPGEPLLERG
jgi:predicted AlkP superfamily phosphohydrolase/phosphomutase